MATDLYGYVNFTNTLDLSKLESDKNISNEDLKKIILQLYSICEQTTLALNVVKNPKIYKPTISLNSYVLSLTNGSIKWKLLQGKDKAVVGENATEIIVGVP